MNTQSNVSTQVQAGLHLDGQCGYQLCEHRVQINIEKIVSHRDLDNISGTLSIQLRGYRQDQRRDDQSCLLASTTIGEMSGQHFLQPCFYDLIYTAPAAGTWQLCLELREWDGFDYVLCDQIDFPVPLVIDFKPSLVENKVTVLETSASNSALAPTTDVPRDNTKAPEKNDVTEPEKPTAKLDTHLDENSITSKTVVTKDADAKEAQKHAQQKDLKAKNHSTKKKKGAEADNEDLAQINECSADDILKVKGLSKQIAKEIVDNRPFRKWKELLNIKGIGPKLLEKIKKAFKRK